jgi:TonB family protein
MNATSIREDLVGRVISGRFPLLRWLGASRGSSVYLTESGNPLQKAAIKLVPADSRGAESRMAAWVAAANLSHPSLMKVFANGRCEIDSSPTLYVVTEYADEILAEIIPQRALTAEETRDVLGPVVDALAYLHAKGFVHGWLKPSNIMASGDRLKLSADGLILSGAIGKPSIERTIYDAPETIQGRIGPAADVWALGATLVEVLTQRPPALYGATAPEPTVPDTVPEPFATIARECLRKDPARRCTLDQIKTWLDPDAVVQPAPRNVVMEMPARAAEVVTAGAAATLSSLKRRRKPVVVGAAVVLLVVFGAWLIRSHREQPIQPAPDVQNDSPPPAAPAPKAAKRRSSAATPTPDRPIAPAPSVAATSPRPDPDAASSQSSSASPATPAVPQDQTSQSSGGVTVKGEVSHQVQPEVLASALGTISGIVKVTVRVSVDASGNVTNAEFDSAGPSKYFANKALDAARHWTFKPALAGGQPTASTWVLNFDFRRDGISATPAETNP